MDFLITNKGIEFYVFFSNCLIYIIIIRTITKYQFGVPELPDERKNDSSWITEKKLTRRCFVIEQNTFFRSCPWHGKKWIQIYLQQRTIAGSSQNLSFSLSLSKKLCSISSKKSFQILGSLSLSLK